MSDAHALTNAQYITVNNIAAAPPRMSARGYRIGKTHVNTTSAEGTNLYVNSSSPQRQ